MEIETYNKIDVRYKEIVSGLYDKDVATLLNNKYENFFKRKKLWQSRLDWFGILIYLDNKAVGHCIVQIPKDSEFIYIGFIELINSPDVAKKMIDAVEKALGKKLKGKKLYLPVEISIWHDYRFKVSGGEIPVFDSFNKTYYPNLFNNIFHHKQKFSCYIANLPKKIKRQENTDYIIRELERNDLRGDFEKVYSLVRKVFNEGHSTPSEEEFFELYEDVIKNADPQYILFAEKGGETIGMSFSFLINGILAIKTIGVSPDFRKMGIGNNLYYTTAERALQNGIEKEYDLFMRDDRLITKIMRPGGKRISKYVTFWRDY